MATDGVLKEHLGVIQLGPSVALAGRGSMSKMRFPTARNAEEPARAPKRSRLGWRPRLLSVDLERAARLTGTTAVGRLHSSATGVAGRMRTPTTSPEAMAPREAAAG
jgi:hypothetical protein